MSGAPRCTCGAAKSNGKRVERKHASTCPLAPPPPRLFVEAFAGSADAKAFEACRLIGLLERDTSKLPMPIGDDPRAVLRWTIRTVTMAKGMTETRARRDLALAVALYRELERDPRAVDRKLELGAYDVTERATIELLRRYMPEAVA